MSENGINIETRSDNHGKYTSILTFDRNKLVNTPTTTTTKAPVDAPPQPKVVGNDYYEQLLNGGFNVKLTHNNNEEKGSRKITIVGDARQAQSKSVDNSAIQNLSTSMILFLSLIILHMIEYY